MKHKRLFRLLIILILVVALATSVAAYMFRKSQTVANIFKPAVVTCKIHEGFDGEKKSEITVENTGNIDAYIRVRLVFHWEDSKGNPVGRDMDPPDFTCYTGASEDWIKDSNDAYTYYYKLPIAPGAFTTDLLKTNIVMNAVVVEEDLLNGTIVKYDYYPVVEVLAEAVQSLPEDAVKEAWGVTLTNGTITSVP